MGRAGAFTARWRRSTPCSPVSPSPLTATTSWRRSAWRAIQRQHKSQGIASWGVVKLVHVWAKQRDHFDSMTDVWEMVFAVVMASAEKREFDPHSACSRTASATRRRTRPPTTTPRNACASSTNLRDDGHLVHPCAPLADASLLKFMKARGQGRAEVSDFTA